MAGLGVCAIDDIALSVLVSVIGHQREKGWILTDGGWMAVSRDRGTARQAIDRGYGLVLDVDGRLLEGFVMSDANQEHGIVSRTTTGRSTGPDSRSARAFASCPITPAPPPLSTRPTAS